jgi:hypothetical protein
MNKSVRGSKVDHAETEVLAAIEKLVNRARAPLVKRTASDAAKLLKIFKVCLFMFVWDAIEAYVLLAARQR